MRCDPLFFLLFISMVTSGVRIFHVIVNLLCGDRKTSSQEPPMAHPPGDLAITEMRSAARRRSYKAEPEGSPELGWWSTYCSRRRGFVAWPACVRGALSRLCDRPLHHGSQARLLWAGAVNVKRLLWPCAGSRTHAISQPWGRHCGQHFRSDAADDAIGDC